MTADTILLLAGVPPELEPPRDFHPLGVWVLDAARLYADWVKGVPLEALETYKAYYEPASVLGGKPIPAERRSRWRRELQEAVARTFGTQDGVEAGRPFMVGDLVGAQIAARVGTYVEVMLAEYRVREYARRFKLVQRHGAPGAGPGTWLRGMTGTALQQLERGRPDLLARRTFYARCCPKG